MFNHRNLIDAVAFSDSPHPSAFPFKGGPALQYVSHLECTVVHVPLLYSACLFLPIVLNDLRNVSTIGTGISTQVTVRKDLTEAFLPYSVLRLAVYECPTVLLSHHALTGRSWSDPPRDFFRQTL